ncbi:hypothetical protein MA16_Dca008454 [Dendrobium catenatum]|uniref:Uncharacterized protein n=1 Tax=Dendrobium catenatum TaxID=906689 RepID=A0A2I0XHH2_9ASPA|nr:hypothetical protein MA16_Dca008454 [Dendrobium catenatum]
MFRSAKRKEAERADGLGDGKAWVAAPAVVSDDLRMEANTVDVLESEMGQFKSDVGEKISTIKERLSNDGKASNDHGRLCIRLGRPLVCWLDWSLTTDGSRVGCFDDGSRVGCFGAHGVELVLLVA